MFRFSGSSILFIKQNLDKVYTVYYNRDLEILRHILRPKLAELSIHLLYNTRYGR